jgi:hypothetical protein
VYEWTVKHVTVTVGFRCVFVETQSPDDNHRGGLSSGLVQPLAKPFKPFRVMCSTL